MKGTEDGAEGNGAEGNAEDAEGAEGAEEPEVAEGTEGGEGAEGAGKASRSTARRVLVLGGTAEARRLADTLAPVPGLHVITSLAGHVAHPVLPEHPAVALRTGGFGGPEALAGWLRSHGVAAVADATHPFASAISRHAAEAARAAGTPLVALRRPGRRARPGDRWRTVASLREAAALLPGLGRRVFLTTGRQGLEAFAGRPELEELWYLIRCAEEPEEPLPPRRLVLLDRGSCRVESELALLREHRIDVLVTKDSGGEATAAELAAAREAGLPVVVVRRPPPPAGVAVVEDAEEARVWLLGAVAGDAGDAGDAGETAERLRSGRPGAGDSPSSGDASNGPSAVFPADDGR